VRFYEATTDIAARPEEVWAVLSDAARWPTWDSGVDSVDGRLALGETVTIRAAAAPNRAFPVKVTTWEPPTRLRFSGGMPLGLFRGVRTYRLYPNGADLTTFHLREEYTGPLLGLIWRSMPDLAPSFNRFARGLKQRVESGD
jgi:uncharacterized protein YndB with AHSA1/START domain